MDFSVGHQNANGLVTGWKQNCDQILEFLLNGNVKDKAIKGFLMKIKGDLNVSYK